MSNEIRAVLIPIEEDRKLLLPNAMVAEVLGMRSINSLDQDEDWILGTVSWRGWDIPLIDFAVLTGSNTEQNVDSSFNLAVLKSINHAENMPYFAVLSRGIPKLQLISRGDMQLHEEKSINHNAIASLVSIQDEMADIPNMNYLESNLIALTQPAA
ncbi:chemotaxis protein CheW [Marinicella sp. S1101]|uniref:chemotaxis protein CheW n=1 Tax=Marinicella marina TaxID=2996016 RepID=UPI002260DA85|nr:chemotaxis protein CheW [Marinicella marina]MCX7554765.1 chemotaxis protein CheW [Marinicella marina]MDJ1141002.1 chemotaxis protein CheW [Marinicella marina]